MGCIPHASNPMITAIWWDVDVKAICDQMGKSPDWMPDILIRGDGHATPWYKKI